MTPLVFSSPLNYSRSKTRSMSPQDPNPLLIEVYALLKDVVAAIKNDDLATVRVAVDCGLDPGSRYNDTTLTEAGSTDGTLLHWAARYDSSDSAQVFEIKQSVHRFAICPRCSSPIQ